jgi:nucleotide-binding universal stress UspA family protein
MEADKMKKVLIALDYDPTAQKVAETGYSLAAAMGAETILLHVISDPAYYVPRKYSTIMGFTGFVDSGPIQLDNLDELKKSAQKYLDKSKHHLGGANIITVIKSGDFAETILKVARDMQADVIVMGSQPEMVGKPADGNCYGKSFKSNDKTASDRSDPAPEMSGY